MACALAGNVLSDAAEIICQRCIRQLSFVGVDGHRPLAASCAAEIALLLAVKAPIYLGQRRGAYARAHAHAHGHGGGIAYTIYCKIELGSVFA